MRWLTLLLAPLLLIATGCATGYTSKYVAADFKKPAHTLLLAESLVFEHVPGSKPPALVREDSLNFGEAMASGVCERLQEAEVDCKSLVMTGVEKRDFEFSVMENADSTNAEPATIPVVAPAKWMSDTNAAAALSSIFNALDAYNMSAMSLAAPDSSKQPQNVKAAKLVFSPDDFTALFGRSITSVVILAQGGALERRKGTLWKDIGLAVGVSVGVQMLTGGAYTARPNGSAYPWFVKLVAVDPSTGEVLWADTWPGQGYYKSGGEHQDQNMAGYSLIRQCPLFKSGK